MNGREPKPLRRRLAALAHAAHDAVDGVLMGKVRLGVVSVVLFLLAAWVLADGSATGMGEIGVTVATLVICGGLIVVLAGGKSHWFRWWPPGRNPRGRR